MKTNKLYYPAVFEKEEQGGYSVQFPDIPEAITQGDTLAEAIEMATECLGLAIVSRKEENEFVPEPDFEGIKLESNQFVVAIEFDSIEFNRKYNTKSIRKNVTIPSWLNDLAEKNNINFSNTLQKALMEMLHIV